MTSLANENCLSVQVFQNYSTKVPGDSCQRPMVIVDCLRGSVCKFFALQPSGEVLAVSHKAKFMSSFNILPLSSLAFRYGKLS